MSNHPQALLPRIFCIPDPSSRVAAVLQKCPRKWWRVGRWDLMSGKCEEGAWFRGTLYPQRCDLSPGGRWLSYFALKSESAWPAGETYNAVARLPWLPRGKGRPSDHLAGQFGDRDRVGRRTVREPRQPLGLRARLDLERAGRSRDVGS